MIFFRAHCFALTHVIWVSIFDYFCIICIKSFGIFRYAFCEKVFRFWCRFGVWLLLLFFIVGVGIVDSCSIECWWMWSLASLYLIVVMCLCKSEMWKYSLCGNIWGGLKNLEFIKYVYFTLIFQIHICILDWLDWSEWIICDFEMRITFTMTRKYELWMFVIVVLWRLTAS